MGPIFQDRSDAGKQLARKLQHYAEDLDMLVLGLARGGVLVGYEVASVLHLPLDVFLVRKLGLPGAEELAMGAIASGGIRVINDNVVSRFKVPERSFEAVAQAERQELERREKAYRGTRPPLVLNRKKILLVDDGLATGASMRAAIWAIRRQHPSLLAVGVPVGAPETCDELSTHVDELVCAETPEPFYAIGTWYANFLQVTDDEVRDCLQRAEREHAGFMRERHHTAFGD